MNRDGPLVDYFKECISDRDADRRWLIIVARRRRARRRMRRYAIQIGTAVAIALAICAWIAVRRGNSAIRETGLVLRTRDESRTLRLDDGILVALGPDTEITVREARCAPQIVDLERGTVHISANHSASAHFCMRAGDVEITDVGAVFSVARDRSSSSVRVSVAEGDVSVVCAGRPPRALHAGESLTTVVKELVMRAPSAPMPDAPQKPSSAMNQRLPGRADPGLVTVSDATRAKSLFADAVLVGFANDAYASSGPHYGDIGAGVLARDSLERTESH